MMLACMLPILPGKQEAWRRFCQELLESRHCEYEESRRRLGITKEAQWLAQAVQGEMAIVYLEVEHPELVFPTLAVSSLPFDRWLRQKMRELHGLDVALPPAGLANELMYVWQTS